MQLLHTRAQDAIVALAREISEALQEGSVLWLVCGGSNIVSAVEVMRLVRASVMPAELGRLSIGQTDERFGPVGHADSNWQQLLDAGFDVRGVQTYPVLNNEALDTTVALYEQTLAMLFANNKVIAQFGIGQDGHIAGALPGSSAIDAQQIVCAYEAPPLVRITLTLAAFTHISVAYAFVFGMGKKAVVARLKEDVSFAEMPSQVLKRIPEAYVYAD